MSKWKFRKITRYIRFDNFTERAKRATGRDKLGPIRDIFEKFIKNSQKLMMPKDCLTVDEQLIPFRGRCSFKQYIPSKPAKYGIKVWALCDASNFYLFNAEIYCGKRDGITVDRNQGENVVIRLIRKYMLPGINITCDNFFTTYSLIEKLISKNVTLVGTIRKNRRELPVLEQLAPLQREYFYSRNTTLINYAPKKNKKVLLLSSMHYSSQPTDVTTLPEIIEYYNKTKGGVDTLDMMGQNYTVKRISRRWPVTIFYHIIDMSMMNAYNVFKEIFPEFFKVKKNARRIFIDCVAISLIKSASDEKEESLQMPKMPLAKRQRCEECPRKIDKKSNIVCEICEKVLCQPHRSIVCTTCLNKLK